MSLLYADDFADKTSFEEGTSGNFRQLFAGNYGLEDAKLLRLPVTTLTEACYGEMFAGCASLTNAPTTLPATTLANECYLEMFTGCKSLITAPELPATTLADFCYDGMFYGCTSLTTTPELLATTLANGCYEYMFYECASLNYVKCMATEFGNGSTTDWLFRVSETGTFVKKSGVEWDEGRNGIPNGWTVEEV